MSDPRLLRLRVELYSAAQMLRGEDATEFWKPIDEILTLRPQQLPFPFKALRPAAKILGVGRQLLK